MRKVLLISSIFLLFIFTGSALHGNILAQETTGTITPTLTPTVTRTNRTVMEEKKEAYKEAKETYKSTVKNTLLTKAGLRFQRVVARFNAAMTRLERIIERVETRFGKLNSSNADKTETQGYIDDARTNIEEAQKLVTQATAIFNAMTAETIQEDYNSVKDLMQEAKIKLVAAKQSLGKAISSMKGLKIGQPTINPSISKKSEPTKTEVLESIPTDMP